MVKFYQATTSAAFAALLLTASPAVAAENEAATTEDVANKKEKPKKITDRNHPDYLRCRSEPIIGSLSRKRRVCMTNREWVAANRKGHGKSRQFIEDMQVGMSESN